MLHQLLHLERPLIIFDTETTGTDPQVDRIVEIGFELWIADGLKKTYRTLVNPGVPIPKGSSEVHKIDDETFRRCRHCMMDAASHPYTDNAEVCEKFAPWPAFCDLASNLAKGFSNCDLGGKNVRFDIRMLAAEFARAKVEWSYVGARIVDAERLEQIAVPRSLSHLYEKYTGKRLEGAHGALVDAEASRVVIERQLEQHRALPRSLDLLHAAQFPGMIDMDGKFRFVDGVAICCFGKWKDKPMRSIEPSYWDWILGANFSADVRAIASAAKLGKFPEVP